MVMALVKIILIMIIMVLMIVAVDVVTVTNVIMATTIAPFVILLQPIFVLKVIMKMVMIK